jgi:hypothetical protein
MHVYTHRTCTTCTVFRISYEELRGAQNLGNSYCLGRFF